MPTSTNVHGVAIQGTVILNSALFETASFEKKLVNYIILLAFFNFNIEGIFYLQ